MYFFFTKNLAVDTLRKAECNSVVLNIPLENHSNILYACTKFNGCNIFQKSCDGGNKRLRQEVSGLFVAAACITPRMAEFSTSTFD